MHVITLDRFGLIALSAQEPPELVLAELTSKYGGRAEVVEGREKTAVEVGRSTPHYYLVSECRDGMEPSTRGEQVDRVRDWTEFLAAVRHLDADAAGLVWTSVLRNIREVMPFSPSW